MPLELHCWLKVSSVLNRWFKYNVDRGTIIAIVVDAEGNSYFFSFVFHFILFGLELPVNYRYSVILKFWSSRELYAMVLDKSSINLIKMIISFLLQCKPFSWRDYIFETSLIQSFEESQLLSLSHRLIILDDPSNNLRNVLPHCSLWSIWLIRNILVAVRLMRPWLISSTPQT